MKSAAVLAIVALSAASLGPAVLAGDRDKNDDRRRAKAARSADSYDHGMHVVANSAATTQPAHGWRYFSDPAARRAVVISPVGDYYYSVGKGLRWVAGTQTGV